MDRSLKSDAWIAATLVMLAVVFVALVSWHAVFGANCLGRFRHVVFVQRVLQRECDDHSQQPEECRSPHVIDRGWPESGRSRRSGARRGGASEIRHDHFLADGQDVQTTLK